MDREISLYEALAGIKFDFTHLDGRKVAVSSPPGKIIGNGETMCVEELGMPFYGRAYKYGNLFILFSVIFPASLTKAQIKTIHECLHNKDAMKDISGPEYKAKQYQGTEQELLARLRKRCIDFAYIYSRRRR